MIGLTLAFTMAIVGDSAKASVDKSVSENFIGDYIVSNVFGGPFSTSIAEPDGGGRRRRATSSASATRSPPATATGRASRRPTRRTSAAST